MLKLQFKDKKKAAIWLVDSRYSIGKDPSNNIVLDNPEVSSFHAELRIEGEKIFLTDTGSEAGTSVNARKVTERMELAAGDIVNIGDVVMELVDPKQDNPGTEGDTAVSAVIDVPVTATSPQPSTLASSGWLLKAKTGAMIGKMFPIPMGKIATLGRSNKCDISLQGGHLSRKHAELEVLPNGLRIKDLGSSNGSYVNRKKITETILRSGDEVRFDTINFQVIGPATEGADDEEDESDQTLFRPAVTPEALAAAAAPKVEKKPEELTTQPKPMDTPAAPPVVVEDDKSGGNKALIIFAVLLLIAGGAAAYFLL